MIQNINITGVKLELDDRVKKYVVQKIGRLDRYLPRHARKSVKVDVKLKEVNRSHGNKYEAEVILNVPDRRITATDTTLNMMAAVDIVEEKLAQQLRRYKDQHIGHIGKTRATLSRIKRSYARDAL